MRYDELARALLRFGQRAFTKKALQDALDYNNAQGREVIRFLSKYGLVEYTSRGYQKREYFIEFLNDLVSGQIRPTQPPRQYDSQRYGTGREEEFDD